MTPYLLIPTFLIGALLYRLRGGALAALWPRGDVAGRLAWAVPTGALCGLLAASPEVALACVVTAYAASLIPHGWCQSNDEGGPVSVLDALGMSVVILGIGFDLAIPVYLFTDAVWWPVLAGAGLAGPAYWVGWRTPSTIPDLRHGTEIGEALTGGCIWVGILVSGVLL